MIFNLSSPSNARRDTFDIVRSEDIPVSVTENPDGSYSISYFPFVDGGPFFGATSSFLIQKQGNFSFSIRVNDTEVAGSPFPIQIAPGAFFHFGFFCSSSPVQFSNVRT